MKLSFSLTGFLVLLCTFHSCTKTASENNSQSGFNCPPGLICAMLDGTSFITQNDSMASTDVYLSPVMPGQNLTFDVQGKKRTTINDTLYEQTIGIQLNSKNLPIIGKDYSNDSSHSDFSFFIAYQSIYTPLKGGGTTGANYYATVPDKVHPGKINFSQIDTINNLCSGEFYFTFFGTLKGVPMTHNFSLGTFRNLKIRRN